MSKFNWKKILETIAADPTAPPTARVGACRVLATAERRAAQEAAKEPAGVASALSTRAIAILNGIDRVN